MQSFTYKIEGLKELDAALGKLPEATAKKVLQDVGKKALEPVEKAARLYARYRTGGLKKSVTVSTRLAKNAASGSTQDRSTVNVYTGSSKQAPHAHMLEFGTSHSSPRPFLRPAWDQNADKVLEIVKKELAWQINIKARALFGNGPK